MRVNTNQLIKFCCTRTVPAAETKSIELPTNAQLSWFLLFHLDCFIVHPDSQSLPRLGAGDSFIVTPDFGAVCQDWQKPRHRDADGASLDAGPSDCLKTYP